MSAAAFAEAGEFDTARQMAAGRKKVLLVPTNRDMDGRSLLYALNIADRTDSDLEVLVAGDVDLEEQLAVCEGKAGETSVGISIVRRRGCVKSAILKHTRRRSNNYVCVVIEAMEDLSIDCQGTEKNLGGIWRQLDCPLTVVSVIA